MTEDQFQKHPVWKWNDSRDDCIPVLETNPLPDDEDTLFILAKFKSASGDLLNGYLVGSDSFYAFGLFVEKRDYLFNLNLTDLAISEKASLAEHLGRNEADIFPMTYEADFRFSGLPKIKGEFSI